MKKPVLLVIAVCGLFVLGVLGFISLLLRGLFPSHDASQQLNPVAAVSQADDVNLGTVEHDAEAHRLADKKSMASDSELGSVGRRTQPAIGLSDKANEMIAAANGSRDKNSTSSEVAASADSQFGSGSSSSDFSNFESSDNGLGDFEDDFKDEHFGSNTNSNNGSGTSGLNASLGSADAVAGVFPTTNEAINIAQRLTMTFQQSLRTGNFSNLYAATAADFRRRKTLESFSGQFQPFVDSKINLRSNRNTTASLSQPPMMDANGAVTLVGNFPSAPPIKFEYRVVKAAGQWRPIDVAIDIDKPVAGAIPSVEQIEALVISKTLAFGAAVHKRDFSDFHREELAAEFRGKYPIAKLAHIFKAFLNERASLDWIRGIKPIFDRAPSLNTDGILQAEGIFPAQPKVHFRYAFVMENAVWKLMIININVPSSEAKQQTSRRIR